MASASIFVWCFKGYIIPKIIAVTPYCLDRVGRWCWVYFQCRGVQLIWITVGQGPSALAEGAGGGCLDSFLSSITSLFFLPLLETAQYRLKYCLKGLLIPKQPTNQLLVGALVPLTKIIWFEVDLVVLVRGHRICFFSEDKKSKTNFSSDSPLRAISHYYIWAQLFKTKDVVGK